MANFRPTFFLLFSYGYVPYVSSKVVDKVAFYIKSSFLADLPSVTVGRLTNEHIFRDRIFKVYFAQALIGHINNHGFEYKEYKEAYPDLEVRSCLNK